MTQSVGVFGKNRDRKIPIETTENPYPTAKMLSRKKDNLQGDSMEIDSPLLIKHVYLIGCNLEDDDFLHEGHFSFFRYYSTIIFLPAQREFAILSPRAGGNPKKLVAGFPIPLEVMNTV